VLLEQILLSSDKYTGLAKIVPI